MTSARPYRAAVSVPSAVAELERCSGREFDPTVVEALVAHVRTSVGSRSRVARVRSVRTGSYAPAMALGIVVFGLVFLGGLVLGSRTRRPLATACVVVGAFCALLVLQANEPFVAFAAFALIALAGLVVDSVRETVGILLGR